MNKKGKHEEHYVYQNGIEIDMNNKKSLRRKHNSRKVSSKRASAQK